MINQKINCMDVAKKYDERYWDGNRKYGYGGYKYIPGRWEKVANQMNQHYNLPKNPKILDIGCGKGYLLFDFSR